MWWAVIALLVCAAVAALYILGVIDRSRDGITDF
jgi:ABC-type multidrug transport system permease subunit